MWRSNYSDKMADFKNDFPVSFVKMPTLKVIEMEAFLVIQFT